MPTTEQGPHKEAIDYLNRGVTLLDQQIRAEENRINSYSRVNANDYSIISRGTKRIGQLGERMVALEHSIEVLEGEWT